ncbi:MAG: siderophore-interacting protein [Candidatus Dormibacteria bacterium]
MSDNLPGRAGAIAAGLPPPRAMSLEVGAVEDLSPSLRQIRLQGDQLVGFEFAPGQDLMLRLPGSDGELVSRRYTIRRADSGTGLVDIIVVMHGDGPAARWARGVAVGQRLAEVIGPRGKITIDGSAAWHLCLGDETYLPGTLAMFEALPPDALGRAVLEVSGADDEQALESQADVEVSWLHRGDTQPGHPDRLLERLNDWRDPPGRGHFYIAAEVRVALRLRDQLLARGVPREQVSAKGYWSRGQANANRGEPDEPS